MWPPSSAAAARAIGALCVGGDWACAHGDLAALRHVARELAAQVPEPLRAELLEIARACLVDPDRAPARWTAIRRGVHRATSSRAPRAAARAGSAAPPRRPRQGSRRPAPARG